MARDNNTFSGKPALDNRVEDYSEAVYNAYDYDRALGRSPRFGKYYYPAMVVSCADKSMKYHCDSYARIFLLKEYNMTKMKDEISSTFGLSLPLHFRNLKDSSFERFSIGRCAEQHAANELLFCIKNRNALDYHQLSVKKDIYFSKAMRPATGEEFPYCRNCKAIFDL